MEALLNAPSKNNIRFRKNYVKKITTRASEIVDNISQSLNIKVDKELEK